MNIPDKLVDEIMRVLIRQVGDHRECGICHQPFIPEDRTSREAHDVYIKLENLKNSEVGNEKLAKI